MNELFFFFSLPRRPGGFEASAVVETNRFQERRPDARCIAVIPPGCGAATSLEMKGDAVVVHTESGVDMVIPGHRLRA